MKKTEQETEQQTKALGALFIGLKGTKSAADSEVSDQLLADYISDNLSAEDRAKVEHELAHNHDTYQRWLEAVEDYAMMPSQQATEAKATTAEPSGINIFSWLRQHWQLGSGGLGMALAAVFAVILLDTGSINQQLDDGYQYYRQAGSSAADFAYLTAMSQQQKATKSIVIKGVSINSLIKQGLMNGVAEGARILGANQQQIEGLNAQPVTQCAGLLPTSDCRQLLEAAQQLGKWVALTRNACVDDNLNAEFWASQLATLKSIAANIQSYSATGPYQQLLSGVDYQAQDAHAQVCAFNKELLALVS